MKPTVYIETYGCSANQNNSEIMAGILKQSGFNITNNENIADVIILNSCVVKGKTESKIKRRIQDLGKNKEKDKLLIISGCMPETDSKQLKSINKSIIFLGINHVKDISKVIRDYYENKFDWQKQDYYLSSQREEKLLVPKMPSNDLISITQISEGCLGSCTFCKTKLAKGSLFSYSQEDILKSIESDLKNGAKEVWITSQDNANYGLDKGKRELPELLLKILSLKHKFKLRLGMMDPNNVLPILNELIEVYKNDKIYKFLHIPVQSASNKVLKDMNRFYTYSDIEQIIYKFKEAFPNITIATDLIVGYPAEADSDFKDSLNFVIKHKPSVLNLSKMSIHKDTPAAKLIPIDSKIIAKRASELMQVHRKTAEENKIQFLNKNIEVFVNKKLGGNLYECRDDYYNIVILTSDNKSILGKKLKVNIKQIGVHHMIGTIVS